ncbi:helix-turn-helix transcriptional regulator [Belnapia arida]|nr:helix-turn-helix domain-containing protein [Belnapia arida]
MANSESTFYFSNPARLAEPLRTLGEGSAMTIPRAQIPTTPGAGAGYRSEATPLLSPSEWDSASWRTHQLQGTSALSQPDALPQIILSHLNQVQLSRRWSMSPRTLERWRWEKTGPRYLKIGGRVLYRLQDIEAYEAAHSRELG